MGCQRLAAFRVDVKKHGFPDHVFACREHLAELAGALLLAADRYEGEIKIAPAAAEEPCELGVE